jgi:hypothetical protein
LGKVIAVARVEDGHERFSRLSPFEFLRNDKLDARNFFAPSVTPFRRNEFGVTFGGPIWIPKLYNGKNKTLFLL